MCRFIAYMGKPLIPSEVLFKPKNSLIKQSIHAHEPEERLNGDGFGLGWYAPLIDDIPALFRSIQPAWNDMNLRYLADKLYSNCFLAHVRSASSGSVSQSNCHPFHYQQYLFMHNGDLGGFEIIKRYLRRELSDEIYSWIKGETDSEHFFGLFLNLMHKQQLHFSTDHAKKIMIESIHELEKIKQKHQVKENSYINTVVTNGKSLVATRYVSDPTEKAPTLYFAVGSHCEYENGHFHVRPSSGGVNGAVLIVSEQLTTYRGEWQEIPVNHILSIYEDLSTSVEAIKI